MRHLDLFAGIGGFSLAARWMGWETVAQVEWDPWCQRVLAKNFPDALRFGDIVEFNKILQNGEITTDSHSTGLYKEKKHTTKGGINALSEPERSRKMGIGSIDILTGGFPCQPFSHAGKRGGVADERYLWPEMLRTIRILKPGYVVGENVAGLVSMENGKTLDRILSDLENEGYTVESFIIPACAIGAWHRRDRIWIIAHSLNGADRTNGRKSREAESISCECGQAGLSGEFGGTNRKISGNDSDTQNQRCETGRKCTFTERQIRIAGDDDSRRKQWVSEPSVGRVANGIPNRVDRLKGLGNAIVPQVVFEIFKAIENYDRS